MRAGSEFLRSYHVASLALYFGMEQPRCKASSLQALRRRTMSPVQRARRGEHPFFGGSCCKSKAPSYLITASTLPIGKQSFCSSLAPFAVTPYP